MSEFYVTVWDAELDRKAKLAGPYSSHDEALKAVPLCRKSINDKYPESHWFYFGTAKVELAFDQKELKHD